MTKRFGNIETAIIVWIACLVYRSFGGLFSGALYLIAVTAVLTVLLLSVKQKYKNHAIPVNYLPEIAGLIVFLAIQEKYLSSIYGRFAAASGALIGVLYIVFIYSRRKAFPEKYLLILTLFALIGSILSPRNFHQLFRSSTFESYVTRRFPDSSSAARTIIEKYAPDSSASFSRAIALYEEALEADSTRNISLAIRLLDESLDLYPFSAPAYLSRGMIRLLHADLSKETAMEAEKDFSSSIRLDSTCAAAYYYRAHAGSYIGRKNEICDDLYRCAALDTAYRALVSELQEKYCSEISTGDFATE